MLKRALVCLLIVGFSTTAQAQGYRLETVADDLSWPWSIAFLPDGSLLVSDDYGDAIYRISYVGD